MAIKNGRSRGSGSLRVRILISRKWREAEKGSSNFVSGLFTHALHSQKVLPTSWENIPCSIDFSQKYYEVLWRPKNVSLFPPGPKVRQSNLTLFFQGYCVSTRSHLELHQRVMLSQGYCQQVRLIARTCNPGRGKQICSYLKQNSKNPTK